MGKSNKCLEEKELTENLVDLKRKKQRERMPKKSLNINPFHGGLSEHSDARDIQHHELAAVENLTVSDIGKVRTVGRINDQLTITSEQTAGSGSFKYASDRRISDGAESPSRYIVQGDSPNGVVRFYEKKADGTTGLANQTVSMGGAFKPVYYYADGVLRIHDADFTRNSKWYGYVDSDLYQERANSNTPIHTITEFVSTDQKLKSFGDLNRTFEVRDASSANPSDGNLSTHINLAYWTTDGGEWSGIYEFGVCPVYKGNQEGPITESSTKIALSEDKLSIQLYIKNASHSPADDAAHDLGDDRIIGVNVYFRENGTEDFYFLKSFDLQKGGKDGWLKYDGSSHTAYGIFAGSIALNADPSSTASYATTTIVATITNSASGFTGRKGFLRVVGGQVSPVYFNLDSLATGSHTVPIVNPGPGSRKFKLAMLDEDFNKLVESSERQVTITDSGSEYPPGYDPDDPNDYSNIGWDGDPDDSTGVDV